MVSLELSKRVTRLDPVRSTTGWSLSEPTQPGSFISEPEKLEPGPTHHGLVGKRVGSLAHLIIFFLNKKVQTFHNLNLNNFHSQKIMLKKIQNNNKKYNIIQMSFKNKHKKHINKFFIFIIFCYCCSP